MNAGKVALSALGWCYVGVIAIAAFIVGLHIHENAHELELPLAGVGLIVAVFSIFGWLRAPKRLRWLPSGTFWLGLLAAMVFAIVHGWTGVVQAVYGLCALVFIVVMYRLRRRLMKAAFPVPPELALEASQPLTPTIYDDANAETIYADKGRLGRRMLLMPLVFAFFGGPMVYCILHPDTENAGLIVVLCGLMLPLVIFGFVDALLRIIRPVPAIVMTRETLRIRAFGIVRWREIVGGYIKGPDTADSWLSRRVLVLLVANPAAVIARQPVWRRILLRLSMVSAASPILIAEQELPMSLEEMQKLMVPYLEKAHDLPPRADDANQGQD